MNDLSIQREETDVVTASQHVIISEPQIRAYLEAFPGLDRGGILAAIIAAGPRRDAIEEELRRITGRIPAQAALSEMRLSSALQLIDSAMHTRLSVADVAAAAGLSTFHFARAFRRTMGQSPHAYLTMRRIERARELLSRQGLPPAEVATKVGFRTQSHFTGVFSKLVGVTPGRYRRGMRNGRLTEGSGDSAST